jgi:type IV fimbrial biogenesis protein FimT
MRAALAGHQSGVTLIELLVVLVVLAVFVTLGIPSFNSVFERNRVTGAAQALYADLQFARAEAIKRNLDVAVNFNTAGWCYGITDTTPFTACDCNGSAASQASCSVNGQQYIVTADRFPGVTLSHNLGSNRLSFEPTRGTLSSVSGTVKLIGSGTKEVDVVASTLGRVRLCSDSAFAGYKSC